MRRSLIAGRHLKHGPANTQQEVLQVLAGSRQRLQQMLVTLLSCFDDCQLSTAAAAAAALSWCFGFCYCQLLLAQ